MSKTIWKYRLEPTELQTIEMPAGATILTVQTQEEDAMLWALVDPDAPLEPRTFTVYGTGEKVPNFPGAYIGTFQVEEGVMVKQNYVFHVFEVPE